MDNIQLDGNIGSEPKEHDSCTTFSIALYAGKHGDTKKTKWYNCVAFEDARVKMQGFGKGAKVRVTGCFSLNTYNNEEREQIIVNDIIAYDPWGDSPSAPVEDDDLGDDIPF